MKPLLAAVLIAVGILVALKMKSGGTAESGGEPLAEVTVPDLTQEAKVGEAAFNEKCASCHGINAAGINGIAPPLIHDIYEPNHHGDQAFYLAAKNGVRGHHWPFGNMPPVEGIKDQEITAIVFYVRELQRANGIH